jgi:Flp pilus assembly protein TadG
MLAVLGKPNGKLRSGFLAINKVRRTLRRPAVIRGNKTNAVKSRRRLARLGDLIARFCKDKRGNVAIMVGILFLPMVVLVGWVIDYSMATTAKTKLQASVDAAALAAVSVNSPIVYAAKQMALNGTNGPVTGGAAYLENIVSANAPSSLNATVTGTPTVTKSNYTVTATLTYSAQVPTTFLKIIGHSSFTITASSTASYTMPIYISFYMLLDVSGSMSFPSTLAEQARLQAVNPDNMNPNTPGSNGYPGGCTFACHFTRQGACPQSGSGNGPYQGPIPAVGTLSNPGTNPSPGGYCQGFIISRLGTTPVSFTSGNNATNGNSVNWTNQQVSSCPSPGTTSCIQLRADAVGYAVNHLLLEAYNTETGNHKSDQFKIGLYPFIVQVYNNGSSDGSGYANLTTSINGSSQTSGTINYAAANLATLLDTGANAALKSGGTNINGALSTMNTLITSVGAGTGNSDYLPYVFLITDGSQDNQTQWNGSWSGSNHATTVDPSNCTTLKNRGITVAVLYIPYMPIQNPTNFAGGEDGAVNAIIPYDATTNPNGGTVTPNIPTQLQACASSGFYYTANTPTDIDNALQKMFKQAVLQAHVTN